MKKQIETDCIIKYYLKVNRMGSIDGKISPCIGIGQLTKYTDETPSRIDYIMVYNNIKGKSPDVTSSITCHTFTKIFKGYDKTPEEWLRSNEYVNVEKPEYDRFYNIFGPYNDVALKSFDDVEECLKTKRQREINRAKEMKEAHVNCVIKKPETNSVANPAVCMTSDSTNNSINAQASIPKKKADTFNIIGYIEDNSKNSKSFNYLWKLYNEYKNDFTLTEIFNAVCNHSSIQEDYLKSQFSCSKYNYYKTRDALSYLKNFKDVVSKVGNHRSFLNMVINFCYNCKEIDNDELYKKLHKSYKTIPPITSVDKLDDAVSYVDKVYNYLRKNKVDITGMFNKRNELTTPVKVSKK